MNVLNFLSFFCFFFVSKCHFFSTFVKCVYLSPYGEMFSFLFLNVFSECRDRAVMFEGRRGVRVRSQRAARARRAARAGGQTSPGSAWGRCRPGPSRCPSAASSAHEYQRTLFSAPPDDRPCRGSTGVFLYIFFIIIIGSSIASLG